MKYLLYLLTFHLIGPQLTCQSITSPHKLVFTFKRFCLSLCPFFHCPLIFLPFFSFALQSFSNDVHLSIHPFVPLFFCPFVLWSFFPISFFSVHNLVCTVRCAQFSLDIKVFTVWCAKYGVHNLECAVQCSQFNVHNLVCTILCTHIIMHNLGCKTLCA